MKKIERPSSNGSHGLSDGDWWRQLHLGQSGQKVSVERAAGVRRLADLHESAASTVSFSVTLSATRHPKRN